MLYYPAHATCWITISASTLTVPSRHVRRATHRQRQRNCRERALELHNLALPRCLLNPSYLNKRLKHTHETRARLLASRAWVQARQGPQLRILALYYIELSTNIKAVALQRSVS